MKKFKKLLSVMLVSTLLVANVIPVSAAEIQPRDAAPALTQFYVYSVSSEKGGTEVIQRSGSFAQVGTTLDHGGACIVFHGEFADLELALNVPASKP